jgi:hypothetical protein
MLPFRKPQGTRVTHASKWWLAAYAVSVQKGAELQPARLSRRSEVRRPNLGVTPLMHSWLSQLATLVSEIPEDLAFAAVLLPIALAIFSKRPIAIWGSTLTCNHRALCIRRTV